MAVIEVPACADCGGMVMSNKPYDERGADYVEIHCMEGGPRGCGWVLDDPDLESRDT